MTNSSPENTTTIGGASPAAAESRQPGRTELRNTRTSEERQVLALEMIADQLALIHADLCSIDDFSRAGAGSGGPDSGGSEAAQDRWDNEGGSFTDEAALDPDVTRSVEQHYAVGGYRYTNLQHAIAEAKRARRADGQGE